MKNRVLNKLMVGIIMTLVVLATVIPAVSVSASNNAEDKVTITLKKGKVHRWRRRRDYKGWKGHHLPGQLLVYSGGR